PYMSSLDPISPTVANVGSPVSMWMRLHGYFRRRDSDFIVEPHATGHVSLCTTKMTRIGKLDRNFIATVTFRAVRSGHASIDWDAWKHDHLSADAHGRL